MNRSALHLVIPGSLDQPTGGYRYDARMVEGLRRMGWEVVVHGLEGGFPEGDARARESFDRAMRRIPEGSRVLVDGLAMGGLPVPVHDHASRLRILALVHHPLAEETGLPEEERRRYEALEREALAASSGVVATSGFTASRLVELGVPQDRVRAVPPGTEEVPLAVGPAPGEPPMLLCVGAVIPRKGHDVLIRSLGRIAELAWQCVVVGSLDRAPEYARMVQEQTRSAGLDGRVRFIGECSDEVLAGLYHASSVFVLASRYEGHGMVLDEALARGLPVVTTTGGAIPDTVPEETGVRVPVDDDASLAAALSALLEPGPAGEERRLRLSTEARRRGAELPDWEAASLAFAQAILELAPDRWMGEGRKV